MTEEEKLALEWLSANQHADKARTIKRMLTGPMLPKEPTPEMLAVLRKACEDGGPGSWPRDGYDALYRYLTFQHTVFDVVVDGHLERCADLATAVEATSRALSAEACVTIVPVRRDTR